MLGSLAPSKRRLVAHTPKKAGRHCLLARGEGLLWVLNLRVFDSVLQVVALLSNPVEETLLTHNPREAWNKIPSMTLNPESLNSENLQNPN